MKQKQMKSRKNMNKPEYVALTRINVPELDTIISRGEIFPNDLMLVDYDKALRTRLIMLRSDYEVLDKSICYSCRAV